MTDTPVTLCPYCRAPASGSFCSSCGKPLDVSVRDSAVARDILGIKLPDYKSIGHTAWLAIAQPHILSRRWCAGDRHRLTSPIALLSIVGALAASLAVIATRLSGNHAPEQADAAAMAHVLDAAPFLRGWFRAAAASADADPVAFGERLRKVGSWLAAAWPALFLLPGFVVLAPWRRISRHDALIVACVETVTIMALAGIFSALRIAAPGIAANGLVMTAVWLALCVHTARHIRRAVPGAGYGYAATRPLLATLVFPAVAYVWMIGVIVLTLILAPALAD